MLLNNEQVNNEVKEEIKRDFETNENEKHNSPKSVGHWDSNPKKKIHSITGLSQKISKSSNKQSYFTVKALEKENKARSEYKEGNNDRRRNKWNRV